MKKTRWGTLKNNHEMAILYEELKEHEEQEVDKPFLSQKNTKEDGFPPTPKGMGIQPTIL